MTVDPIYVLVLFVNEPARIDDLALLAEFAQLAMGHARAASARAGTAEAEGADPTAHLELILPNGRRIAVAPGFDPQTLRRLIATVEGDPCSD